LKRIEFRAPGRSREDGQFVIFLLSGRHWTPITGGVSHTTEGLSNRGGVPDVPGEEIVSISSFERRISNWEGGNQEVNERRRAIDAVLLPHGKISAE
jgi:hypothetical protein